MATYFLLKLSNFLSIEIDCLTIRSLPVHTVVSDVDELAQLARAVVAGELDLLLGEPSLKLSTRLVLRRVAVQDLHHEDGKLLVGAGAHGHPDVLHQGVALQLDLPHTTLLLNFTFTFYLNFCTVLSIRISYFLYNRSDQVVY